MITSEKRYREYYGLMNRWMYLKNAGIDFTAHKEIKNTYSYAIYGLGNIGKRAIEEMNSERLNVIYYVDKNAEIFFADKKVYTDHEPLPEADVMIVTQICEFEEIYLKERVYFSGRIISLKQVVDDLWKTVWSRNDSFD